MLVVGWCCGGRNKFRPLGENYCFLLSKEVYLRSSMFSAEIRGTRVFANSSFSYRNPTLHFLTEMCDFVIIVAG